MITEDYVSFEIAKLLKEKGFNETCRAEWLEYIDGPSKGKTYLTECGSGLQHDGCSNISLEKFNYDGQMYYTAPTHQMAMKWLREKEYAINIDCMDKCFTYKYYIKHINNTDKHTDFKHYNTYESACEAAIKYCLEHLI